MAQKLILKWSAFFTHFFVGGVLLYQVVFPFIKTLFGIQGNCSQVPSCSQFMIESLKSYGPGKGLYLGLKRVLSCHPFRGRDWGLGIGDWFHPTANRQPPIPK